MRREAVAEAWTPAGEAVELTRLPRAQLAAMRAAGEEILECYRVLRKAELNIVGEVLRGAAQFREYDHYPEDDVYDRETRSQYYYHSHRGVAGEHGHFHAFVRSGDGDAVVHVVAISMDAYGYPIGLFAPNRWVAAGDWHEAGDVFEMSKAFRIDHAWPSWPVNRWMSAMVVLFRPHIGQLLIERDQALAQWRSRMPGEDVLERRDIEILAQMPISVERTLEELRRLSS